jgi:hypothetical protein
VTRSQLAGVDPITHGLLVDLQSLGDLGDSAELLGQTRHPQNAIARDRRRSNVHTWIQVPRAMFGATVNVVWNSEQRLPPALIGVPTPGPKRKRAAERAQPGRDDRHVAHSVPDPRSGGRSQSPRSERAAAGRRRPRGGLRGGPPLALSPDSSRIARWCLRVKGAAGAAAAGTAGLPLARR